MLLEFNESDLLQSKVIPPAWYAVEILDVEEKMSKNGDSTNAWIKGKVLWNAENGSIENAGVPTPYLWMINSKGAFSAVGIFSALGMEIKAGSRANTDALKGKRLEMFIGNELYNGQMKNSVAGMYRPLKSEPKAA